MCGRASQAEGTANTKALTWDCAWAQFKHELGSSSSRPVWLELVNGGQSTKRKFSELRSGETSSFTLMRNHWRILLSRGVTSDLQLRWIMTEVSHARSRNTRSHHNNHAKRGNCSEVMRNSWILYIFWWWNQQDLLKVWWERTRPSCCQPWKLVKIFPPSPVQKVEICTCPDSTYSSQTI